MSLFIGLPNLHIEDAAILVYPDHISFESASPPTSTLSVYINRSEMAHLGERLIEVGTAPASKVKTMIVETSTVAALVDRVAEAMRDALGSEPLTVRPEDFIYELASTLVEMATDTLAVPAAFGQEHLS